MPSRLSDSVSSVKASKNSSFDNFVKANPGQVLEKLRAEWNLLSDEEKQKFKTGNTAMDYKSLDDGNMFFEDDIEDDDL